MRERPIIFSGPMVRAILENRKCQTRRVVKPQIMDWTTNPADVLWPARCSKKGLTELRPCPHGVPGDKLWVKETHHVFAHKPPGHNIQIECVYRADPSSDEYDAVKWTPSIFMPRWASRITLEITGVRVERVQDISATDALAEGIAEDLRIGVMSEPTQPDDYIAAFSTLWDSVTKRGFGWDSNSYVWVVEFKRVEAER